MGKRGPKPIREPTTHVRVPVSMAETLKEAAAARNVSIAVLLDSLRSKIVDLLPMPPSEDRPCPGRWVLSGRARPVVKGVDAWENPKGQSVISGCQTTLKLIRTEPLYLSKSALSASIASAKDTTYSKSSPTSVNDGTLVDRHSGECWPWAGSLPDHSM